MVDPERGLVHPAEPLVGGRFGGYARATVTDIDRLIIPFSALDVTKHAEEFVGADHGDVPFSIILVHAPTGGGPKVHRHPYAEVFIVESGEATFTLGEATRVVSSGHVVIGPPEVAHGFMNSGAGELRLIAIHGAPRFITEWLPGGDATWTSPPKRESS